MWITSLCALFTCLQDGRSFSLVVFFSRCNTIVCLPSFCSFVFGGVGISPIQNVPTWSCRVNLNQEDRGRLPVVCRGWTPCTQALLSFFCTVLYVRKCWAIQCFVCSQPSKKNKKKLTKAALSQATLWFFVCCLNKYDVKARTLLRGRQLSANIEVWLLNQSIHVLQRPDSGYNVTTLSNSKMSQKCC